MRGSSGSSRGGGWVVGQTILMALIVGSWFLGSGVTALGVLPATAGVALVAWAVATMRESMTPGTSS